MRNYDIPRIAAEVQSVVGCRPLWVESRGRDDLDQRVNRIGFNDGTEVEVTIDNDSLARAAANGRETLFQAWMRAYCRAYCLATKREG